MNTLAKMPIQSYGSRSRSTASHNGEVHSIATCGSQIRRGDGLWLDAKHTYQTLLLWDMYM